MQHRERVLALLAPMPSELRPLVRELGLRRAGVGGLDAREGLIDGHTVVAIRTGMGTARAARATERLLDEWDVRHAVVVGVAGGVRVGLRVGDVIVPAEVIDHATGRSHRAHPLGGLEPNGRIVTTDELLVDPVERARSLPADVDALDMETAAVATVCERRTVPWTAVRALSDHVDERLVDDAVYRLARPDGSPDLGAVARHVLTGPWRVGRLARLGLDLQRATRSAARAATRACREHDWAE